MPDLPPACLPRMINTCSVGTVVIDSYNECYEVATGKRLWQYPNEFAGVHGSKSARHRYRHGARLVRPRRCAKVPVAGYIWAITTNVGEWHLLTQDGYYLTRLFEPDPMKFSLSSPGAPGASIDQLPCGMGGEDFGGSLVRAPDGKVYLRPGNGPAGTGSERTGEYQADSEAAR